MRRLALLAALFLVALAGAILPAADAKLPKSLDPELACEACNATLIEAAKMVNKTKYRLGKTQAISAALEKICTDGHKVFVTWKYPPLKMKEACFKLMESYDETFEEILQAEKSHAWGFRKVCKKICDDVPAVRPPITEPLDIIRVDNKPVKIKGEGIPDFPDDDDDDEL